MVAFFIGDQQRTRRKEDLFGAISSFFFGEQQKTWRKLDQPKNFGPPKTNFAPLTVEQRSSCGTGFVLCTLGPCLTCPTVRTAAI